jgi:hypothetical protein
MGQSMTEQCHMEVKDIWGIKAAKRKTEGRKKKNQKLLAHETNSLLILFMYFFYARKLNILLL